MMRIAFCVLVAFLGSAYPATAQYTVAKIAASFPSVPNFYSPGVFYDSSAKVYKMWATVGDGVRYFTSPDGVTWSNGVSNGYPVFTAQAGTWEDDGGSFTDPFTGAHYTTGISDPRVLKNITPGYAYTMYYTAGNAPNTATRGGIGIALSQDGINWTHHGQLRSFVNGNIFAAQALKINNLVYLYYEGGYPYPLPCVIQSSDGLTFTNSAGQATFLNGGNDDNLYPSFGLNTYPLYYDDQTQTYAMADGITGPSDMYGEQTFPSFQVYLGGNGRSTMGNLIATVDSTYSTSGFLFNFDAETIDKDENGHKLAGSGLRVIFSASQYFAHGTGFQPVIVSITPPPPDNETDTPLLPTWAWPVFIAGILIVGGVGLRSARLQDG